MELKIGIERHKNGASVYIFYVMALQRSGTFVKSGGISSAIAKQLRIVNLKPIKRITIKYDPFKEDVKNIRDFNTLIFSKKTLKTNLLCLIKTEVQSDRSESQILFDLNDGKKFLFKCNKLTTLDILEQINKHITPLAPPVDTTTTLVATKSEKKGKKK